MIKSFRGQLADGGQDKIRLGTIRGQIGYKIVKFQIIGDQPGAVTSEHTVKLYTTSRPISATGVPTVDAVVNFNDPLLLGVAYYSTNPSTAYTDTDTVIFDNVKFNQDIFVTHTETNASNPVNYYLELEQVKLSLDETTVATLKDMRGRE